MEWIWENRALVIGFGLIATGIVGWICSKDKRLAQLERDARKNESYYFDE